MGTLLDWIDSRFGVRDPHRNFLQRPVPLNVNYSYCLGGAAFVLFMIAAITGLLLSFYYVPSGSEAYRSIIRIQEEVRLGWLVRAVHKWAAHLLIVFVLLHAVRVFVSKAYRPPRELNWVAGALTVLITLASGFTGYLLPWDQKAYWATVVGTSMAGTVPLIGGPLLALVRGGAEVDGTTLVRFYSLHVLHLPLSMAVVLWAHFHMVKKQGISGGM